MKIMERLVGDKEPVYIIAEIGINHNGDIETAKKLIDVAVEAGCDAVKFQKRNPDVCVPEHQKNIMRETPWGYITYLDYKYKIEFDKKEYDIINEYCNKKKIHWFVSCWDIDSVNFVTSYDTPCIKVASASITEKELLQHIRNTDIPVILSTGMSNWKEINNAYDVLKNKKKITIMQCTSLYPCPIESSGINVIKEMKKKFKCNTHI